MKHDLSVSLKTLIGTSLILLVSLYLLLIVYISVPSIKKSLEDSNQNILKTISSHFKSNINNALEQQNKSINLSQKLILVEDIQSFNTLKIEEKLLSILNELPEVSDLFLGKSDGNFLMVQNYENYTLTKIIVGKRLKWIKRNKSGTILERYNENNSEFNTLTRDWYVNAKLNKKRVTSNIRRFFTRGTLGLTQSMPIYNENQLIAVLGSNLSLKNLNEIAEQTLKLSKVNTFIYDNESFVISSPLKLHPKEIKNRPFKINELRELPITSFLNTYLYKKDKNKKTKFHYSIHNSSLKVSNDNNWNITTIISQQEYLGEIRESFKFIILVGIVIFLIIMFILTKLSNEITKPLQQLMLDAIQIKQLNFSNKVKKHSLIKEIKELQDSITLMKYGLKSFTKYVPYHVVENIIQGNQHLMDSVRQKKIPILFSDIQNFSYIMEKSSSNNLNQQLTEYFNICGDIIAKNLGQIDKYIGDSIMAFWDTHETDEYNAILSCYSALEIAQKMNSMSKYWENKYGNVFHTRFGLSYGLVNIGNFGSKFRTDYTLMGTSVNLANRLETTNKLYGTHILVSKSLHELVKNELFTIPLDIVIFQNTEEKQEIFAVLDIKSSPEAGKLKKLTRLFNEGIENFRDQKWKDSAKIFADLYESYPEVSASSVFLKRSLILLERKPESWSSVIDLNTKKIELENFSL